MVDIAGGVEAGLQLAQRAEQIQQQRAQIEDQKQLTLIKVGDHIMESFNKAALIQDPKARQQAYIQARRGAESLKQPMPDDTFAVLTSPEYRNELLQGTALLAGLPDKQKAEQYGGIFQMFGSGATTAQLLNSFKEDRTRQAQLALQQQQLQQQQSKALTSAEDELRKERSQLPVTKDTSAMATSYNKIRNVYENPSPAGDLSMIFNFMKLIDPPSTVREGEQASAQNTAGVPERIRGLYNRVLAGTRLVPEQRDDFFTQAGTLYRAQIERQKEVDKTFTELARVRGIAPERIFIDFAGKSLSESSPQQIKQTFPSFTPEEQAALIKNDPEKARKYGLMPLPTKGGP